MSTLRRDNFADFGDFPAMTRLPVVLLPARAAACALTGGSHSAVARDYGRRNEASMGRTSRTFAEPTVGQRQATDLQAPAICSM
jgi:hypothetical protein